jgi:pimeloyl-ACP methyl ester carboxylesterase
MQNPRTYGKAPFRVAVLHGGPGAPGAMAPVARELSREWGVLEPLQTAVSLEGQVQELRAALEAHAGLPAALVGSSWGAMLGFILAARCPALVRKLILVGSGVYEEKYAAGIQATRLARLDETARREVLALLAALGDPAAPDISALLARLGALYTRADAYDPLTLDTEVLDHQYDLHRSVWADAVRLRAGGGLLELGRHIRCPVVALHGDYDPHPAEGVRAPLAPVVRDFRFILLERCGHLPWIERQARDTFFAVLRAELR